MPASTPAGTGTPLSTQDVIGGLAFRARSGPDRSGAPMVLAPPHQWAVDGTGAASLLQSVDAMLEAGFLTPLPLAALLAAGPPATARARSVSYPLRAGGREVVGAVADTVRATEAGITDLRSAAVADSGVGLSPDSVLNPLVRGLLRPMSAAWRGRPEAAAAVGRPAAQRIAELRGTVRVLEPPSPYALGTSDAPLLVTIGNGLPFTVRVRLEIASTSGLRVAPIEMQQVPPLGRRQARVSAQVTRSGQFTVQAAVRSPDGQLLGPPSRLRVRSTAYGTITVWLTASAGVLLVVLAVRRIRRRVGDEPPPHTGPIPVDLGLLAPVPEPGRPTRRRPRPAPERRTPDRAPGPGPRDPAPPGDPPRSARSRSADRRRAPGSRTGPRRARHRPVRRDPDRAAPHRRPVPGFGPDRGSEPAADRPERRGPEPPRVRPRPAPRPPTPADPTSPLRLTRPAAPNPPRPDDPTRGPNPPPATR